MLDRVILFGASGDLAARLLLPALAQLEAERQLPERLEVLAVGTESWSTEEFRGRIDEALAEHAPSVPSRARDSLVARLAPTGRVT